MERVSRKRLDTYINSQHRVDRVFGLAKKSSFWCKDIVSDSSIIANNFIKSYEDSRFKVYYSIPIIVKGNESVQNLVKVNARM